MVKSVVYSGSNNAPSRAACRPDTTRSSTGKDPAPAIHCVAGRKVAMVDVERGKATRF